MRAGLPRGHQGHEGLQGGGQGLRRHGAGDARAQEGDDAGRARRRRLRLPRERHPPLGSRFDRLRRGGASRLRRRGLHGSAHVLAHRLPRLRAHPRPRLAAAQPSQPLDEDRPHQGGHGRARSEGVRLGGCARPRPVLPGRPVRVRRRRGAPRRKLRRARGEVTALVEPSGSGKSTCAQLAAKFWEPDSGRPFCSGKDIAEFSEESWLAHVSIVFQDAPFRRHGCEQYSHRPRSASDEEVAEAARAAHCLEFIERLPQGSTRCWARTAPPLGRERQRLSIARALLKDAPVVLLDEATARSTPSRRLSRERSEPCAQAKR
ncbi:MAG: ATP-binding cassette domain-containing protein [Eggerthella lenta]